MSSIPVDELGRRRRVSLDSAVLMSIADGKRTTAEVSRLHEAMERVGAVLIVSEAHCSDAAAAEDAATRSRIATAIDAFPQSAYVLGDFAYPQYVALRRFLDDAPDAAPAAPYDVVLLQRPQLGASLLCEPTQLAQFQSSARNNAAFAQLQRFAYILRGAQSAPPGLVRSMIPAIVRADTADKLATAAFELVPELAAIRDTPAAADRPAWWPALESAWPQIRAQLHNMAAFRHVSVEDLIEHVIRQPVSAILGFVALDVRGGFERWLDAARQVAPGFYFSAKLAEVNVRDGRRRPDEGDRADHLHAMLAPYMDLVTVDRHNFEPLDRARRQATTIRPSVFLRNPAGSLQEIIDAIAGLKT